MTRFAISFGGARRLLVGGLCATLVLSSLLVAACNGEPPPPTKGTTPTQELPEELEALITGLRVLAVEGVAASGITEAQLKVELEQSLRGMVALVHGECEELHPIYNDECPAGGCPQGYVCIDEACCKIPVF